MPCLLALAHLAPFPTTDGAKPTPEAAARAAYAKLPLRFEPNRGQIDARVRFLSRGAGYSLFLTQQEAVLSLTKPKPAAPLSGSSRGRADGGSGHSAATVRIRPVGANVNARMITGERQSGQSNYLSGNDRGKWVTGVPGYEEVRYREIYPGIDLVYHGRQRKLEYDFVVAPGAAPRRIALDIKGARRLSVDRRGDLILHTRAGRLRQERPFVYQRLGKTRKRIEGRYVLQGKNRVGFSLGAYDHDRPLVIDPVLAHSTYLGGRHEDVAEATAIANGCVSHCEIYVVGRTQSMNFPTLNGVKNDKDNADSDAFVTKLNASGSELMYSTYLGGSGSSNTDRSDAGRDIAVDGSGSAYVVGETSSRGSCLEAECDGDFPTTPNRYQGYGGGGSDAFVTKLSPSGSRLIYSTFLGALNNDYGRGIALAPACASACEAYLTGVTNSPNFPTRNPVQSVLGGGKDPIGPLGQDAFVTRLNDTGSALTYSTYLGGGAGDTGEGIAVDAAGNAYVTGYTFSSDFPTEKAYQSTLSNPGESYADAFVTKLHPTGSRLEYSTYLGGSSDELGGDIAVDASERAYVTGVTTSTDFRTTSQPRRGLNGDSDAYVTKLNALSASDSAVSLSYSTYLGGSSVDEGTGVAVDASGAAYVTGSTASYDFPTKDASQDALSGGSGNDARDAYVTKLDPLGSSLSYSTFLGGEGQEDGNGIAVDGSGNAYVVGQTRSSDFPTFPTETSYQRATAGGPDGFVTKLSPVADVSLQMTATPDPAYANQLLTYTLSAANHGPETAGATLKDALPGGVTFVSASPDCSHAAGVVSCWLGQLPAEGLPVTRQIVVRPTLPNRALRNTASVQSGGVDPNGTNDVASVTTEVRSDAASGGSVGGTSTVPGTAGSQRGGNPGLLRPSGERRRASALRRCLKRASRSRSAARRHALRRRCLARYGRRPGRVGGLRARALSGKQIVLTFRAPAIDAAGGPAATRYVVKQSTRPIKGKRGFRRARSLCRGGCRVSGGRVGGLVRLTITDLRPRTTYYYAIAARDNVSGRVGPRSPAVRVRTR